MIRVLVSSIVAGREKKQSRNWEVFFYAKTILKWGMVQLAASHLWLPEGNPSYCIRRHRFVSARGRSRVNWASSPSLPRLFPDFYGVLLQPMDPSQCWARSSSLASWGQVVNNHQQCHLTAGLDNFHPPRDPVDSSSRIRFCHGWCLQRHWKTRCLGAMGRASAFLVWKMLEKSMENWRISLQDGYQ